jgi:predicted transposase YbfD/YdcC
MVFHHTIHLLLDGSPAHQRVFSRINPEQFQKSFLSWVKGISKITEGEIIALDGKQSRSSGDDANGKGVLNTVSAWAVTNRLVLGQKMVEGKSNEITAETHYFISSLADDAKKVAGAIRGHWGIENSLHWVLDVSLGEDYRRNKYC